MTETQTEFSAGKAVKLHEMFRWDFENGLLPQDIGSFRSYVDDLAGMPALSEPKSNGLGDLADILRMSLGRAKEVSQEYLDRTNGSPAGGLPAPEEQEDEWLNNATKAKPKISPATESEAIVKGRRVNGERKKRTPGTWAQGEKSPQAKLTRNDVVKIKKRIAKKEKPGSIAADFDCSVDNIRMIARGKTWKHVTV